MRVTLDPELEYFQFVQILLKAAEAITTLYASAGFLTETPTERRARAI